MVLSEPRLETRSTQHYLAIRKTVKMGGIGRLLPPLLDEVRAWMQTERIRPAGTPFFRYWRTDIDTNQFVVDVGWPVSEGVAGEGEILGDSLPAGQYAVIAHTGPLDNLFDAYNALFDWCDARNYTLDRSPDKTWGARVEHYLIGPADEPDAQEWQAEVALLLRNK